MRKITLDDIIEHFGGTQESLAKQLGCSRTTICMWGGLIPEARAHQIAAISKGKFKVRDMPVRPSAAERYLRVRP